MKRRDFIKTGLMGTTAVSIAPTALLSRRDYNVIYWAPIEQKITPTERF